MSTGEPGWMVVGRVAGTFGVRGELKVEPLTDFLDRFERLDCVYLGPQHTPYRLERSHLHKSHVLFKLDGIDSPESAGKLHGLDVEVPRSHAVDLPEGHYFLADLIGLAVRTPQGMQVGTVTDVLRTGSNDVYVVTAGAETVLIPGIRDAVVELDLAGRELIVEPWVLEPGV